MTPRIFTVQHYIHTRQNSSQHRGEFTTTAALTPHGSVLVKFLIKEVELHMCEGKPNKTTKQHTRWENPIKSLGSTLDRETPQKHQAVQCHVYDGEIPDWTLTAV